MNENSPKANPEAPIRTTFAFHILFGDIIKFESMLLGQEGMVATDNPNSWQWEGYVVNRILSPNSSTIRYSIVATNERSSRSFEFGGDDRLLTFDATSVAGEFKYRTFVKVDELPLTVRRRVSVTHGERLDPIYTLEERYKKYIGRPWQMNGVEIGMDDHSFVMDINGEFPHDRLAFERPTDMEVHRAYFV